MNKGDNHFLNVCVGRGVMYSDAGGAGGARGGGGGCTGACPSGKFLKI